MSFKIWFQIEENSDENVGEPVPFERSFEDFEEAAEAMANLVAIDSGTFWGRLLELSGLDFRAFSLIVYDKPCPELEHIHEYLLDKYAKFQENPLGLILTLDSRNFQRVFNFLIRGETP